MSGEAYELLALLMRYVFVVIGALIVFRAARWMLRDARAYQKEIKTLPDAGLVGEMVDLTTDRAQPLPREGTIGSSRDCDIRVKGPNVLRHHARFEFEEGKGLKIIPSRRGLTVLSGVEIRKPAYALHGTQLTIGNHVLRVRLFAGLNVPLPARYPEPDAILEAAEEAIPWEGMNVDAPYWLPEEQAAQAVPFRRDQGYDGNYDEDGQMTWQHAYSMEELRQAQAEQNWIDSQAEEEEAPPAQRRRRRGRRE